MVWDVCVTSNTYHLVLVLSNHWWLNWRQRQIFLIKTHRTHLWLHWISLYFTQNPSENAHTSPNKAASRHPRFVLHPKEIRLRIFMRLSSYLTNDIHDTQEKSKFKTLLSSTAECKHALYKTGWGLNDIVYQHDIGRPHSATGQDLIVTTHLFHVNWNHKSWQANLSKESIYRALRQLMLFALSASSVFKNFT